MKSSPCECHWATKLHWWRANIGSGNGCVLSHIKALHFKCCPSFVMYGAQWIIRFEISLIRSSETSKNDSQRSGIPAGLVRWTTAYFWFSHKHDKWHWVYIFQTCEWYIQTIDFYNPLAWRTSAFNLKFQSWNSVFSTVCLHLFIYM